MNTWLQNKTKFVNNKPAQKLEIKVAGDQNTAGDQNSENLAAKVPKNLCDQS